MSAAILAFPQKREPTMTGEAICTCCDNTWQAVVPIGSTWLECPTCGVTAGRMRYPVVRAGHHWTCPCGNDLFHVMPDRIYCPSCGIDQSFPN
jgi:hypothetical protein